jgi:hypothetical protein
MFPLVLFDIESMLVILLPVLPLIGLILVSCFKKKNPPFKEFENSSDFSKKLGFHLRREQGIVFTVFKGLFTSEI